MLEDPARTVENLAALNAAGPGPLEVEDCDRSVKLLSAEEHLAEADEVTWLGLETPPGDPEPAAWAEPLRDRRKEITLEELEMLRGWDYLGDVD